MGTAESLDCRRCGFVGAPRVEPINGQHVASCSRCGRFIKNIKQAWTIERARMFRMPYGRHKGATIAEIASTKEGMEYLRYMSRGSMAGGNAIEAMRCYLDHYNRRRGDA